MKKRIISLLLVVAVLATMLPAALAAGEYKDTAGHWGEDSIDRWTGYGVVGGYGDTFLPNGEMTRAELARVLVNLLDLQQTASVSQYQDVKADDWFYSDIAKCVAAGILNGVGSSMEPNRKVTREEMFTMFARALGIAPKAASSTTFADGDEVSSWAAGYINALADMGVISGVGGGKLDPGANINRASVMRVLDNAISDYANTDGVTVGASSGIVLVVADHVTVAGNVENLVVAGSNNTVTLSGGVTADVAVLGENSTVNVSASAAVNTVVIDEKAAGSTVNVAQGAAVAAVDSKADRVTITGEGVVETAVVSGDHTTVNTDGTDLTVAVGTVGVTENSKPVSGGATVETEPVKNQGTVTPSTPSIPVLTYYTVTFVSDGAALSTQQVLSGTTVAAPAEDPTTTAQCKAFGGWTVNGAAYDFAAAVTGDLTITAQWNDAHTYVTEAIKAADDENTTVATQEVCSVCGDKKDVVMTGNAVAQVGEDYYVDVAKAIKAGNEIVLLKDTSISPSSMNSAIAGKDTTIDLNSNTLTVPAGGGISVEKSGGIATNLAFKNGNLVLNNTTGQNANIAVATGSSVSMDEVKVSATGSVLFPRGDAASVTVTDSEITTTGSYVIATNASTAENYNVVITVTGSTLFVDNSTVLVNVPCTLNIENSTIIGKFHSVIARGGNVTIKNSTLDNQIDEGTWGNLKGYFDNRNWASGNTVQLAALTVGNKTPGSYQYATHCSLENVKFIVGEGQRTVSIHGNATADIGAYLNYDLASEVGTVEVLGGYVNINGEVKSGN